jgi:predicted DNA binding CopG/RHH family protein
MDKKELRVSRGIISGYENGSFEPARNYDRSEFKSYSFEDPKRRDNRVSIRVSGKDLEQLHKLALEEGVPSQSLIANIVHKYVNGLLLDAPALTNDKRVADITKALFMEETKDSAEFARSIPEWFRRDF